LLVVTSAHGDERTASADTGFAEYWARWEFVFNNITAMCFTWCLLFSTVWWVAHMLVQYDLVAEGFVPNSASVRSVIAILVSIIAFMVIHVLDYLSDIYAGDAAEKAMRGVIRCLGVLVGFAWEQAFAGGVESIVEQTCGHGGHGASPWPAISLRLGMALIMGVGVVPAWRMYILRSLLVCQASFVERKAHAAKGDDAAKRHAPAPDGSAGYSAMPGVVAMEVSEMSLGELEWTPPTRSMFLSANDQERMQQQHMMAASRTSSAKSLASSTVFSDRMNNLLSKALTSP